MHEFFEELQQAECGDMHAVLRTCQVCWEALCLAGAPAVIKCCHGTARLHEMLLPPMHRLCQLTVMPLHACAMPCRTACHWRTSARWWP